MQGNFDDYAPLRMNEVPPVEAYYVESTEAPIRGWRAAHSAARSGHLQRDLCRHQETRAGPADSRVNLHGWTVCCVIGRNPT